MDSSLQSIYKKLIPIHIDGKKIDINKKLNFSNLIDAEENFFKIKQKLEDPNQWFSLCNDFGAKFLVYKTKIESASFIEENNYIRIDIPGPGSGSGNGYDWVKVESIVEYKNKVENINLFAFLVRASPNPFDSSSEVSHFFKENATSSFILFQQNQKLILSYFGRNEKLNINTKIMSIDMIRNFFVGIGAKFGFSRSQWELLLTNLIK